MAFLDANGVTRLVTNLNSIYEYKISAGGGIAINASNAISIATSEKDKLDHIYVQTPTSGGSGAPETYWSFGLANTSTPYTFSYWNGFNNATFGNYFGFGTTNNPITDGGLRLYIGSKVIGLRDYTNNTAGSYFWKFDPTILTVPYENQTVTLSASSTKPWFAYGYFGSGTSPALYINIPLPAPIKSDQEISNVSITGDFRSPGGLLNGTSSLTPTLLDDNAVLLCVDGTLRIGFKGSSFTSNNTANTPVVVYVRSLTFEVSDPS